MPCIPRASLLPGERLRMTDHALTLPTGYSIGPMTRAEAGVLGSWAVDEGWNPGLADIDIAWAYDSDAFIALRHHDTLAGGGAIVAYERQAGFMGLFIMRANLRQQGLGRVLWHERLRRLRARLNPGAPIGMAGVFDMVPFYEAGGFAYLYRDLRYQGAAQGVADPAAVPLGQLSWPLLQAYDARISGLNREGFMRSWLTQDGGKGFAILEDGAIEGYGYLRPCPVGYKLAPLYARNPATARRILGTLLAAVPGAQVQIDVPEPNTAALALMAELGWDQCFGCANMVNGPVPHRPLEQVFGVTSFEFG